jgi:hypothetical protein
MNKNVQIVVFFILVNLFTVTWAKDMNSPYVTSQPYTLHMLPMTELYCDYDVAEVFIDANDNIIVLSSFSFEEDNIYVSTPEDLARTKYNTEVSLSVFHHNTWSKSSITQAGRLPWRGMLVNGQFQAYSRLKEPSKVETVSIYDLNSDMKLSSQPAKTIKMDKSKKALPQERNRYIHELLPLTGEPDKFIAMGYCYEFNPINLIAALMLGGHWGFVGRLFAAPVEQYDITGYYGIPAKLKANECLRQRTFVISGTRIHSVMKKGRDYYSDPEVILYAEFDLSDNRWSKPVELFKDYKNRKTSITFRSSFSRPYLACYNENIYCVWDWDVVNRTPKTLRATRPAESGIYFCSRVDDQWTKPVKIVDSGVLPRVLVGNDGAVYVFWIEPEKGLFYKIKTGLSWSDTYMVVKDKLIKRIPIAPPSVPPLFSSPFSVAVDQKGNLHIVYARCSVLERRPIGRTKEEILARLRQERSRKYESTIRKFKPEELVYVKLAQAEGVTLE